MLTKNEDRSQIYKIDLDLKNQNDARIIAYNIIKPHSSVLDVGCACGDFGVLISRNKHCDVYGMECDPVSIQIARDTKVFSDLHEIDLNQFEDEEFKEYHGFFDYISMLDVLEHIINPDQVLLKIKKFLKRNGLIILSIPNVSFGEMKINLLNDEFTYTDTGILDRTHLRFFTYKTIIRFFTDLNFEICESKVKVADVTFGSNMIPFYIKNYILKNPHSYVYQYVITIIPSNLPKDELVKLNSKRMDQEWIMIKQELKKIRKYYWMNKIFPVGSKRRTFVEMMYKKIFKRGF